MKKSARQYRNFLNRKKNILFHFTATEQLILFRNINLFFLYTYVFMVGFTERRVETEKTEEGERGLRKRVGC